MTTFSTEHNAMRVLRYGIICCVWSVQSVYGMTSAVGAHAYTHNELCSVLQKAILSSADEKPAIDRVLGAIAAYLPSKWHRTRSIENAGLPFDRSAEHSITNFYAAAADHYAVFASRGRITCYAYDGTFQGVLQDEKEGVMVSRLVASKTLPDESCYVVAGVQMDKKNCASLKFNYLKIWHLKRGMTMPSASCVMKLAHLHTRSGGKSVSEPIQHIAFSEDQRILCAATLKHVFVFCKSPDSKVLKKHMPIELPHRGFLRRCGIGLYDTKRLTTLFGQQILHWNVAEIEERENLITKTLTLFPSVLTQLIAAYTPPQYTESSVHLFMGQRGEFVLSPYAPRVTIFEPHQDDALVRQVNLISGKAVELLSPAACARAIAHSAQEDTVGVFIDNTIAIWGPPPLCDREHSLPLTGAGPISVSINSHGGSIAALHWDGTGELFEKLIAPETEE